mmetsp:Transcript_16925/g.23525  ORF Transcript_16925/g.23525 Transcript_16925/m.23525 type:complete len:89 (-) Transcript_16925:357-623(-)
MEITGRDRTGSYVCFVSTSSTERFFAGGFGRLEGVPNHIVPTTYSFEGIPAAFPNSGSKLTGPVVHLVPIPLACNDKHKFWTAQQQAA